MLRIFGSYHSINLTVSYQKKSHVRICHELILLCMTETEIRTIFSTATTRHELLSLLNRIKKDELGDKAFAFTLKQLNYFCNSSHTASHYHCFGIPKKSGGVRTICAPQKLLKSMLSCVSPLLQAIYTPSESATGFIPGRSVVDNARKHTGKLYVFNSDLKDFFPSISKYRVRAALMAKPICASAEMADAIANLCCAKMAFKGAELGLFDDEQPESIFYKDYLPQGSPASPAMTNIVCRHLDWQMEHLARKYGCEYSRYADDMTFSSNRSIFAKGGEFYREFSAIVAGNGFTINEAKTRVQKKGCRQEVTGLTVGDKVNVSKAYVRDLTNVLHIWEKYGYADAASKYFAFHKDSQRPFSGKPGVAVNLENIIRGKINYLKMVKGEDDPVYLRCKAKFDSLIGKSNILTNICYSFTTILKIPRFEKVMKCNLIFKKETRILKDGEFSYFFGEMTIYGKPTRAFFGENTRMRLLYKYKELSIELLNSLKTKFFISRCYCINSRVEFWVITDHRPFYNPDYAPSYFFNEPEDFADDEF